MPTEKDIIYPVFLECCQFAKDTFWKKIFEELSKGNYPYGTYISKDHLCCGYKDKEFSYKIERKDPEELYNDVYYLLTEKVGILSQKDRSKKRLEFGKIEDDVQSSKKNWGDIKKKNIKNLLIEIYVIDMKNKHSLSVKQAKYLLSIIFIAMIFKVIISKDIHYSDGKITKIEGIDFVKGRIILQRNIYDVDGDITPEIVLEKKYMYDNWEKYLNGLKKIEAY
jgi:hypothetical protein